MATYFLRRKWANVLFVQKNQRSAPFSKLIRKMPLFWNAIFGQSSYSKLKIKKKKKFNGTRAPWTRVPCNFLFIYLFLSFTYSCVSWRPIVAFFMELKFHELEFHFFFFFFFKFDRPIFYFLQIELQKRGISLISLGNGAKHWNFCAKRAFAYFGLDFY